jgi:hypothetical protein
MLHACLILYCKRHAKLKNILLETKCKQHTTRQRILNLSKKKQFAETIQGIVRKFAETYECPGETPEV